LTTPAWHELEQRIRAGAPASRPDLDDVPEPVARYFTAALGGAGVHPPAAAAVLEMRGEIRLRRWLPFRSRQLLAPRMGTVWEARVACLITGSDRYVAGVGAMDWRLLGLIPVMRAEGPDVSRSAAARAAGESIWVPGAVAPGTGTVWTADGADRIGADVETDGHAVRVEHSIDAHGRLVSSSFLRWGDPDGTGTYAEHRFGVDVLGHRRFGDVTIPDRGEVGWHHGTDRWEDGRFFRYRITAYEPFG